MTGFSWPKFDAGKLHLSTRIYYDQFDPRGHGQEDSRQSLANLDYSPLPRVTWPSFIMGIMVSMGGFL